MENRQYVVDEMSGRLRTNLGPLLVVLVLHPQSLRFYGKPRTRSLNMYGVGVFRLLEQLFSLHLRQRQCSHTKSSGVQSSGCHMEIQVD